MTNNSQMQVLLVLVLLVSQCAVFSVASATAAPSLGIDVAGSAAKSDGGSNIIFSLVGYVKDSVVRTVDGSRTMWMNHGKCNEIRGKQRDYRNTLKEKWEYEEKGLTRRDLQDRLKTVTGGVTYDEFCFLSKGKEDRGKLMNLVFLMFGAPKFFPYALMFYPDMLPSAFAPLPDTSAMRETKLEKLSRQRAHAVVKTLLRLEQDAKVTPAMAKLNIFGKKKQQQALDSTNDMNQATSKILTTPGARQIAGAHVLFNTLDDLLYTSPPDEHSKGGHTRGELRLATVPQPIIRGLVEAIEGPTLFQDLLPGFMNRGKVVTHVEKITVADTFLVNEKVDLNTLSTARLLDACNDRLIGGPSYNDNELRQGLQNWLQVAVVEPTQRIQRTGQSFNPNLARVALLGYHALEGTRDDRAASYLPRLLFQGQRSHQSSPEVTEDRENDKKGRK
jgi:hypothetical protein